VRAAAVFVVALLTASSARLPGQVSGGTLTGTIATADGTPVPSARVRLIGTMLTTVADARGTFRIAGVPAIPLTLDVRMVGYAPSIQPIDMVADSTFNVKVVLAPIPLDAVEVDATFAATPALRGFEDRMARGPGVFFTREDILRMQARLFTDILRRVPGLQIRKVNGAYGENYAIMQRGRSCPLAYNMNGTPFAVPPDIPINHFVSPDEVVAVEVYSSSEIPPHFNASANRASCGLVVIWTRVGHEQRRPK
jgi:hypothetical protein